MEVEIYKIKNNCGVKDSLTDTQVIRDKRWDKTSELFYFCKNIIEKNIGNNFEKAIAYFIVNRVSFSGLTVSSSVSKSNTDTILLIILYLNFQFPKLIKHWNINNL